MAIIANSGHNTISNSKQYYEQLTQFIQSDDAPLAID